MPRDAPPSRGRTPANGKRLVGGDGLTTVANRLKTPMFISERAAVSEEDTIAIIEDWLHIPTLTEATEDDIDAEQAHEQYCTDHSFPPNDKSMYVDPENPPVDEQFVWQRVMGQLYIPTGHKCKLLPGGLPNKKFLGALAAVASRSDLLLDLIVSNHLAERGLYTFQFYKHGCWQPVVVDSFLPHLSNGCGYYACSAVPGELWPSLLEKAYAKVHGSYFALSGGCIGDCLVDLTGGAVTKVKLDSAEQQEKAVDGTLWAQLVRYTSWGYVLAVEHVIKDAADNTEAPGGLLLNHAYSILDTRELADGTKLLHMHNPWQGGVWRGSWGRGSVEWTKPQYAEFAATVEETGGGDDSLFWISYWDFIQAFNRMHVLRLFPPMWHQLTLHSGWQGPTSGGPATTPDGSPSSSWCCNPQFRITVRKPCEVLVCLSQRDPQVANGGHVPKKQREFQFGCVVLRSGTRAVGRCWAVKPSELVVDTGLSGRREHAISMRIEPGAAYTVVPYAGAAGTEGPFVLRTFSSAPLEVEQIPSPLSLVLGGAWMGPIAGGCREHATWGSNPQYMLNVQHKAQVVISLARMDMKHAVIPVEYDPEAGVGLLLTTPDMSEEGPGRKLSIHRPADVVAETGHDRMDEALLLVTLEPEQPYVLVPSAKTPGVEAPFEIRILSGVPVELVTLPDTKSVSVRGALTEETAGGSDLQPSWKRNPKFLLRIGSRAHIRFTLRREGVKWKRNMPLDSMLGCYILRADDEDGALPGDMRKAIVAEAPFLPMNEVSFEYDLHPGVPGYVIMPCTYGPKQTCKFTLTVTSNDGSLSLVPLERHAPPMLSAPQTPGAQPSAASIPS